MTHQTHTPKPRDQVLIWRETSKEMPATDDLVLAQFPDGSVEVVIVDALDDEGDIVEGTPKDTEHLRVSPGHMRGDNYDTPPDWWAPLDLDMGESRADDDSLPRVAFSLAPSRDDDKNRIVTVERGASGHRPTHLTRPTFDEALALATALNAAISVDSDEALRLTAASFAMHRHPEER